MSNSLDGKHIIVTGAGGELGSTVSLACVQAGATVSAVHRGYCDVTDPADVNVALGRRRFDGLVHCAGVLGPISPLDTTEVDDLKRVIEVNVLGSLVVAREAIRQSKRYAKAASIVLVAGGGDGVPNFATYAASKAAVIRLTEVLAAERHSRMRFNALAPGALPGRMRNEIITAGESLSGEALQAHRAALQKNPTAKAADCAVWLLSDQSAHVNGRLVSAQYDKWPECFKGTGLYQLRRQTA